LPDEKLPSPFLFLRPTEPEDLREASTREPRIRGERTGESAGISKSELGRQCLPN
jgi:hypothetical protein